MGVPFDRAPRHLFSRVKGEKIKSDDVMVASNQTPAMLSGLKILQETLWILSSV